jgi:hypothetical protein
MNMHTEQHFCVYYMKISREQHSGFRSNNYILEKKTNFVLDKYFLTSLYVDRTGV